MGVVAGYLKKNSVRKILMKIVKYLVRLLKPFKNFVDNILFLFKYNIQERNISAESLNHYLDNIRYEIQGDMKIPVRTEIKTLAPL